MAMLVITRWYPSKPVGSNANGFSCRWPQSRNFDWSATGCPWIRSLSHKNVVAGFVWRYPQKVMVSIILSIILRERDWQILINFAVSSIFRSKYQLVDDNPSFMQKIPGSVSPFPDGSSPFQVGKNASMGGSSTGDVWTPTWPTRSLRPCINPWTKT